ncbi:hypothetical protein [Actinomadura sp. DC4]|uniref:tetratricopeptide repeat protein n=1 Tax=Actinomadura sp. DC4 TaxID=3055069 RepID=UPI0025B1B0FD|nr:hypothetical protein [Actinomadura sp. DC4]MDN3354463.1 hypothetical protein [Actinomadura sp. DC4]
MTSAVPRLLVAARPEAGPDAPSRLLLSGYLDLGHRPDGPRHAEGVALAYDEYVSGPTTMPLRRQPPGSMRRALAEEWPHERVGTEHPADRPRDERSPRWQHLCDGLEAWPDLPAERRAALLGLCNALGYFGVTVDLGGRVLGAGGEMTTGHAAQILLVAAAAARIGGSAGESLVELCARGDRQARILARTYLVGPRASADAVESLLADLRAPSVDRLVCCLGLLACAWSFDRAGDLRRFSAFVAEAHDAAGTRPATHAWEDCRRSVAEARTVVALRSGEVERAVEIHREIIESDPFDAQACLEHASLLERLDLRNAAAWYQRAVRLGAPLTGLAFERAGDAQLRGGDPVAAFDSYASSVSNAGGSPSALRRLAECAGRIGQREVARWALERLDSSEERHATPAWSVGTFTPGPILRYAAPMRKGGRS